MDRYIFDAGTWRLWGSGELRASERHRAISLSVNPTGAGVSGSPNTKGCCSGKFPKSWFASEEFGSKGVTIICGPGNTESVEKIDLGLRLRLCCTKVAIPIKEKTATTPAIIPPEIAPVFLFRSLGDGKFEFVQLGFIVCTGAL